MLNQLTPPSIQGIDPSAPMGFLDTQFSYTYDVTLTADQTLFNEVVSIFSEADFAWRALIFTATDLFAVRFQDGQGYYISAGMVFSTNLPNSAGDPFPWFPEILYPAGGQIQLDIQDLSGAENVIQILFVGANRYRIAQ